MRSHGLQLADSCPDRAFENGEIIQHDKKSNMLMMYDKICSQLDTCNSVSASLVFHKKRVLCMYINTTGLTQLILRRLILCLCVWSEDNIKSNPLAQTR